MKGKSSMASRIISIVGAGIVLATFVVKDVLDERMKDLNDSLSTARSFYLTQLPLNFIEGDVNQTNYKVSLLLLAVDDKDKHQSQLAEDKISAALETNRHRAEIASEYLVSLVSLISHLPTAKDYKATAVSLYAQCVQVENDIGSLQARKTTVLPAFVKTPNDPRVDQQYKEFSSTMLGIPPKIDQISHNSVILTTTVVSNLQAAVERTEKRHNAYTVALYILGCAPVSVGE